MNKGETIPQTVENLQEIMAADAVLMQKQGERIRTLNLRVAKLERKLAKCRHLNNFM